MQYPEVFSPGQLQQEVHYHGMATIKSFAATRLALHHPHLQAMPYYDNGYPSAPLDYRSVPGLFSMLEYTGLDYMAKPLKQAGIFSMVDFGLLFTPEKAHKFTSIAIALDEQPQRVPHSELPNSADLYTLLNTAWPVTYPNMPYPLRSLLSNASGLLERGNKNSYLADWYKSAFPIGIHDTQVSQLSAVASTVLPNVRLICRL